LIVGSGPNIEARLATLERLGSTGTIADEYAARKNKIIDENLEMVFPLDLAEQDGGLRAVVFEVEAIVLADELDVSAVLLVEKRR
jgi:hypothetical protein